VVSHPSRKNKSAARVGHPVGYRYFFAAEGGEFIV